MLMCTADRSDSMGNVNGGADRAGTYVSSVTRFGAAGYFSKANDRDIKKGRATSCPAGGHWRGINHPREGLHFNAPGWISTERVERTARLGSARFERPRR